MSIVPFAKGLVILAVGAALVGCSPIAVQPYGPSVAVMPAPQKPFEQYRQEHATCKQFAAGEVAGAADQANLRTVGGALVGAGLGAGVGAAAGGGFGAGVGAASGAVLGAYGAANDTPWGVYGLQQRYDIAFEECMYAEGNQVPGGIPGYQSSSSMRDNSDSYMSTWSSMGGYTQSAPPLLPHRS